MESITEANKDRNIADLQNVLIRKKPILFLGAGFSIGSVNNNGVSIPSASNLSKMLIKKFYHDEKYKPRHKELEEYGLDLLCQCIENDYSRVELQDYLISIFKEVQPAIFHEQLVKYNWSKIYTTNIDDLIENIYKKNSVRLCVQNERTQKKCPPLAVELYKLHGCVNNPDEQFIFSKSSYSQSMIEENFRFKQFCNDFISQDIIFLGTKYDESNLDYFIQKYKASGFSSNKGEVFFISPNDYPYYLDQKIDSIKGKKIKWTTKEFLAFISALQISESELKHIELLMRQKGFVNISEYQKDIDGTFSYSSYLYFGDEPIYDDIFNEWDCISPLVDEIIKKIESQNKNMCICLHGKSYIGKSCIGLRIAVNCHSNGIDVLDFSGKEFDSDLLRLYINQNTLKNRFLILIEDGSFFYKDIEYFLNCDLRKDATVYFLTISNDYYHKRKRYIFSDSSFIEFKINSKINKEYAKRIVDKLDSKGYLGNLRVITSIDHRILRVMNINDIAELMFIITNGDGFSKYYQKKFKTFEIDYDDRFFQALLSICIFSRLEINYYPLEILYAIYADIVVDDLIEKYDYIIDLDESKGIKVRCKDIVLKHVFNTIEDSDLIINILEKHLKFISNLFDEKSNNKWRNIYEYISKEKMIRRKLNLNTEEIRKLFYAIKDYYDDISYYWLQLGLCEQEEKEFDRAYNHFMQAKSIRPHSYQIQHAIGRNYLRKAYYQSMVQNAKLYFDEGERILVDLIKNSEYNQGKAYSVHCYIFEKIRYLMKFNLDISSDELKKMQFYIKNALSMGDEMIKESQGLFYSYCSKVGKLGVLDIPPAELSIALNSKKNFDINTILDDDID